MVMSLGKALLLGTVCSTELPRRRSHGGRGRCWTLCSAVLMCEGSTGFLVAVVTGLSMQGRDWGMQASVACCSNSVCGCLEVGHDRCHPELLPVHNCDPSARGTTCYQ